MKKSFFIPFIIFTTLLFVCHSSIHAQKKTKLNKNTFGENRKEGFKSGNSNIKQIKSTKVFIDIMKNDFII